MSYFVTKRTWDDWAASPAARQGVQGGGFGISAMSTGKLRTVRVIG